MKDEEISRLAAMIKESENTVFFGGAGVSTESGIKDYRSEDGIYNSVKEYGVSPEVILSHDFLFEHPEAFYDFCKKYFFDTGAKPNKAHKALARLEKEGMLNAVITQNIDNLHQLAGSRNVIELHGTTKRYYCSACGEDMAYKEVEALGGAVPHCRKCGALVRPDVTLYGEMLNEKAVSAAVSAISAADLLIVGGTSLVVYPAASYLGYFRGRNIVLINKGETSFDSRADIVLRDSIGEVFDRVMSKIL